MEVRERIIDRTIEIWKELLTCRKYDNGDRTLGGMLAMGMAAQIPNNVTPELLEKFGEALKRRLLADDNQYFLSMHVDYGPDKILHDSAEEVCLKVEFPFKTDVSINWKGEDTSICVRNGYSAPYVYHYPLPDGRWLVTSLTGPEIGKVKEYVAGGKPEFRVDA